MPLRFILGFLLSAFLANAAPAKESANDKSATSKSTVKSKEKNKPAKQKVSRTWMTVVDYVLANGMGRTLKAPLTKNLKFESDAVSTKALRYKLGDSPDKKNHAFYVVFTGNEDGKLVPKEFVVGSAFVVKNDDAKSVEDFFLRVDLNGNIVAAVSSKGPSGKVIETIHPPDSQEALTALKAEKLLHLKTMDLEKLSK